MQLFLLDSKLQIGIITHQKAKSRLDGGDVPANAVSNFYIAVRAFFEKAIEYSLCHLPLNDELLQNASFLNFEKRLDADGSQPENFISRQVPIIIMIYHY